MIKYNKLFYETSCKKELNNDFCIIIKTPNCLTDLLNKLEANCTKIKERNIPIEIISEGNIVITGSHIVNNKEVSGINLIQFEKNVNINNKTYINTKNKILEHMKFSKPSKIKIIEFITSFDLDLKYTNIDYIEPYLTEVKEHPIMWGLSINFLIIVTVFAIFKLFKYYQVFESKRTNRDIIELMEETETRANILIQERLGQSSID